MKYEIWKRKSGMRHQKTEIRNQKPQKPEPGTRSEKTETRNKKPETRNQKLNIRNLAPTQPSTPPHSVGLWFWLVTEWLVNPESLSRGISALAQKMKIYCIWKFQTKKKGMFILIFYLQIDMASCKSGKD